jgi:hypothetical protein
MLDAEVQGLDSLSTSTFSFATKSPVRLDFGSAPNSSHHSNHRWVKSIRRSFDSGTRITETSELLLGDRSLLPTMKSSPREPTPILGHCQEGEKHLDVELTVETNVFHSDHTLKYMKLLNKYKELGLGKDIELPRVCENPPVKSGTDSTLAGFSRRTVLRKIESTREFDLLASTYCNRSWNEVSY